MKAAIQRGETGATAAARVGVKKSEAKVSAPSACGDGDNGVKSGRKGRRWSGMEGRGREYDGNGRKENCSSIRPRRINRLASSRAGPHSATAGLGNEAGKQMPESLRWA